MSVPTIRDKIKSGLTCDKQNKLKLQAEVGELNKQLANDEHDQSLLAMRELLLNDIRHLDVCLSNSYRRLRISKSS